MYTVTRGDARHHAQRPHFTQKVHRYVHRQNVARIRFIAFRWQVVKTPAATLGAASRKP